METSRLTVAIPVYNDGPGLKRAVGLIDPNLGRVRELLIINDGSTDDTAEVAEELARERPRVRVLHNEGNRGVNYTINRLAREAAGSWILYVSSNDEIFPGLIPWAAEKVAQFPDVGVILSDFILDNGKKERVMRPDPEWAGQKVWDRAGFQKEYLAQVRPSMSASAIYHRETMLRFGGFQEICGAYSDLMLINLLGASRGAVYSPGPTVRFIVDHDSFVRSSTRGPIRAFRLVRRIFRLMKAEPHRELLGDSYPESFLFECTCRLLRRDLQPFFAKARARWPKVRLQRIRAVAEVGIRLVSRIFWSVCIVESWVFRPQPHRFPGGEPEEA